MEPGIGLTKLVHVAIAFTLIAGVIGRDLLFERARVASDVRSVATLVEAGKLFDRALVIPSSGLIAVSGVLSVWMERLPLFGFLQGAHGNWLLASTVFYVAVMAIIGVVFIPRRKALDRELALALEANRITTALAAAVSDRAFRWARGAELTLLAAIVVLMVLRPF